MFVKLNIILHAVIILTYSLASAQLIRSHSKAFGDQLRIGYIGDKPNYTNPFQVDNLESLLINHLIFGSGLLQQGGRFGEPNQLIETSDEPESTQDHGLIWRYMLRRDIYFHNNSELRNTDVLFTFNLLKKWGGNILNKTIDFSNIKSIEKEGDLDFTINLYEQDVNFDNKFSDIPILLKSKYQSIEEQGYQYFNQNPPIGYGPFKYEKNTDNTITLNDHAHYVFGQPFLDKITFHFYQDEQQLFDAFIQDKIDFMEVKDLVTARRLHQIIPKGSQIFYIPRPEIKIFYIQFNVNKFPLQDQKDRNAIRNAINLNQIIDRLVEEKARPALSLVHPDNEYFYEELEREKFNPGNSLKLLNNNGWIINRGKGTLEKRGVPFEFELLFERNSNLEEKIARTIKIDLADIGINVQPIPVDNKTMKLLISRNNFTAALNTYSYLDDDILNGIKSFYFEVLNRNPSQKNYHNTTLDRLFQETNLTSSGIRQVIELFQFILHREIPVIFLFFDEKIIFAVQSRFQDVKLYYSDKVPTYYKLNPFENWFVPKSLQKFP